jgi:acyl-CoA thioester hydrolase
MREVAMGDGVRSDLALSGPSPDASRRIHRHQVLRADGYAAVVVEVDGFWHDLKNRKLIAPPADIRDLYAGMPRTEQFETLQSSAKGK